ncbi:MAG: hypothetical protein AAFQ80_08460 [Cyanobacteria bacterium J06621_8]
MDYLIADKNTLIWFCFTVYGVTALFLVPNGINLRAKNTDPENSHTQELQFAARLVLRLVLIVPMLAVLTNTI